MSNKKRLQKQLKEQYLEQMKQNRALTRQERQAEKEEQMRRIEEAHLSLDRESDEKKRIREKYIDDLNFYGGQKRAERSSEQLRQQMEKNNDMDNIEKYV